MVEKNKGKNKRHKLSIIIPCFNEKKTLLPLLSLVESVRLPRGVDKEIILVDDGSTDGTRELLKQVNHKVFFHKKNKGKGGAVKTGLRHVTGDIVIIQDADMEYDPNDYSKLIEPIISGDALVVYGSRRLNKDNKQYSGVAFYLGGILLSFLTSVLFGQWITDEPTCYKVFRKDIIDSLKIVNNRFDWEPEVTAKIMKKGIKIFEVPIYYYPRSVNEGKKIGWRDGVSAIVTLIKYRFVN